MRLLLIVDPQYDFISGTLPVPNATEAMQRLAQALPSMEVDAIYITMDCHTVDHCSFQAQGGEWPSHCVKYSPGAAIDASLFAALADKKCPLYFIEKGTLQHADAYSAFAESCPEAMYQADTIYVAGIAGDVCVHTTLSDLMALGLRSKLCVLSNACPSLDGGERLSSLISTHHLTTHIL